MKVKWFVSNYPHRGNQTAGIFYRLLAEALAAEGLQITVVSPTPYTGKILPLFSSKWRMYATAPRMEVVNGVTIHRPRYITASGESNSNVVHQRILKSAMKLNLPKPDLVHGFGAYPVSLAAVHYAKEIGVKNLQTFIGSDVNEYPQRSARHLNIFKETCAQTDKILAVSKDLCNQVHALTGRSCEWMQMPVKYYNETHKSGIELLNSLGLPNNSFKVLYAGLLSEEKGILDLLSSMQLLKHQPEVQCILVGKSSLSAAVFEKHNHVKRLGELPHEQLLQLMKVCDLLVMPSHSEGIPGVIKEAGQCELPVIATSVGGIPEIINSDTGYIIEPRNEKMLAETILHVMAHREEAKTRAKNLSALVKELFHPNLVAQKQIKIYKELFNGE